MTNRLPAGAMAAQARVQRRKVLLAKEHWTTSIRRSNIRSSTDLWGVAILESGIPG